MQQRGVFSAEECAGKRKWKGDTAVGKCAATGAVCSRKTCSERYCAEGEVSVGGSVQQGSVSDTGRVAGKHAVRGVCGREVSVRRSEQSGGSVQRD